MFPLFLSGAPLLLIPVFGWWLWSNGSYAWQLVALVFPFALLNLIGEVTAYRNRVHLSADVDRWPLSTKLHGSRARP
ncbi:hypothetical protein [Streptomonospora litoralis]|nr:hypothetical protein [Streptomonospora litoralis]